VEELEASTAKVPPCIGAASPHPPEAYKIAPAAPAKGRKDNPEWPQEVPVPHPPPLYQPKGRALVAR